MFGILRRTRERIDHAIFEERVTDALKSKDWSLVQSLQKLQNDSKLPSDPGTRIMYWIVEFKDLNDEFCVVYDRDGKIWYCTEDMAEANFPELSSIPTQDNLKCQEITTPVLGHQRILRGNLRVGNQEFVVVLLSAMDSIDRAREEAAREQAEVEQEFRTTAAILLACIPLALLLVAAVGYWLARKALAPVERLNRLAESITAQRLDRRLPVVQPEDELGRLSNTMNAMIARLERSFQEMQRFTADASHEMRTPLTVIRAETELALGKTLTPEEQHQMLVSVAEECERLARLTDQLLTLSREDAGSAQKVRQPVDLVSLVQQVAEIMTPLIDAKGLQFQMSGQISHTMDGDEAHLREVVINLLDNAIKYTPPGGKIAVQLAQKDNKAMVQISDSGIGIAPEHQSHVFERFYRVDLARSRAEGGTGLGLSIVQSIVQAHGGEISLVSELGKGTIVTVALPMSFAQTA